MIWNEWNECAKGKVARQCLGFVAIVVVAVSLAFLAQGDKRPVLEVSVEYMATGLLSILFLFFSIYCFGLFTPSLAVFTGLILFTLFSVYLPGFVALLPLNWLYLQVTLGLSFILATASLVYSSQARGYKIIKGTIERIVEKRSESIAKSLDEKLEGFHKRLEEFLRTQFDRARSFYSDLEERAMKRIESKAKETETRLEECIRGYAISKDYISATGRLDAAFDRDASLAKSILRIVHDLGNNANSEDVYRRLAARWPRIRENVDDCIRLFDRMTRLDYIVSEKVGEKLVVKLTEKGKETIEQIMAYEHMKKR